VGLRVRKRFPFYHNNNRSAQSAAANRRMRERVTLGATTTGVSPVPVQMWTGVRPVPAQMWLLGESAVVERLRRVDHEQLLPNPLKRHLRAGGSPVQVWQEWAI
jgi:hypothetical protein